MIHPAHPGTAAVEEEAEAEAEVAVPRERSDESESTECAICLDDRTAFTCIPCGHQCVCAADGCTAVILGKWQCPMCDQGVTELMHADKAAVVLRAAGRRVYHC